MELNYSFPYHILNQFQVSDSVVLNPSLSLNLLCNTLVFSSGFIDSTSAFGDSNLEFCVFLDVAGGALSNSRNTGSALSKLKHWTSTNFLGYMWITLGSAPPKGSVSLVLLILVQLAVTYLYSCISCVASLFRHFARLTLLKKATRALTTAYWAKKIALYWFEVVLLCYFFDLVVHVLKNLVQQDCRLRCRAMRRQVFASFFVRFAEMFIFSWRFKVICKITIVAFWPSFSCLTTFFRAEAALETPFMQHLWRNSPCPLFLSCWHEMHVLRLPIQEKTMLYLLPCCWFFRDHFKHFFCVCYRYVSKHLWRLLVVPVWQLLQEKLRQKTNRSRTKRETKNNGFVEPLRLLWSIWLLLCLLQDWLLTASGLRGGSFFAFMVGVFFIWLDVLCCGGVLLLVLCPSGLNRFSFHSYLRLADEDLVNLVSWPRLWS